MERKGKWKKQVKNEEQDVFRLPIPEAVQTGTSSKKAAAKQDKKGKDAETGADTGGEIGADTTPGKANKGKDGKVKSFAQHLAK